MDSPDQGAKPKPQDMLPKPKAVNNLNNLTRREVLSLGARGVAIAGLVGAGVAKPGITPFRPRKVVAVENPKGQPYAGRPGERIAPMDVPESFTIIHTQPLEFITTMPAQLQKTVIRKIEDAPKPKTMAEAAKQALDMANVFDNSYEKTKRLKKNVTEVVQKYKAVFGDLQNEELFVTQVLALIWVESKGKFEKKKGPSVGYTQIEENTYKELVSDLEEIGINVNPETEQGNLLVGALYFKRMLDKSNGDFIKATARYNLGPGLMEMAENIHPKGKAASFEELITDPTVKQALEDKYEYIAENPGRVEYVYRYPAALIKLFYQKEFETLKKAA